MLTIAGWCWLNRAAYLRGIADSWVVSDRIETADAAVVLGGDMNIRAVGAAELYNAGTVRLILMPGTAFDTDIYRAIMIKRNVPPQAIVESGDRVISTYEEARAVRQWAQRSGAKKVIIVTEKLHGRRVKWIFDRELAPLGVKVMAHSVSDPNYDFDDWWKDRQSIAIFSNEALKYIYYRLRY